MKKILFAADGSESALNAAKLANQFLDVWPEATVQVVYITQVFSTAFGANVPSDFADEIAKEVKDRSMMAFKDHSDRVEFRHETNVASPGVVIAEIAKDEGFDLIVCGSHGRNAVNRFLLGSVSHGIVNRAEVPVLVAKQHADEE